LQFIHLNIHNQGLTGVNYSCILATITRPPVGLRKARKIWIAQEWAVALVPDMAVSFQTAWWTFRKVKGA
jgi:hypothetical protein